MEPGFNIIEFIAFWYTQGRPPVSIFPFESHITQMVAYLAVLIVPIINVVIEFYSGKHAGIRYLPVAALIYLVFYMLLDAAMLIEYGRVEAVDQSLAKDYFTPLKAVLYLAFLGSCARMVELTVRKIILEKKKNVITLAAALIYTSLSIVSIGLLYDFIRSEFCGNSQVGVIAGEEEGPIPAGHPSQNSEPGLKHDQITTKSTHRPQSKAQPYHGGRGELLVVFGSEYPCATSLLLYVDGIESGIVTLPGRLKVSLAEGVHQIAFGSSQSHVDQVKIFSGNTSTVINPIIDCKPLHPTELTEILTREELEELGFR